MLSAMHRWAGWQGELHHPAEFIWATRAGGVQMRYMTLGKQA